MYYHTVQGKRESNEDQHFIFSNLDGKNCDRNNINMIGVFDVHGGKLVSKYLKENLPDYFTKKFKDNLLSKPEKFSKYVSKVFDTLQTKLIEEHPKAVNYCGSTACLVIHCINKLEKKGYLWVINIGDSRAVLNNKNYLPNNAPFSHLSNLHHLNH